MLTRDIALDDAILDLLDNCLDGVTRSQGTDTVDYNGYHAKIIFSQKSFKIEDNCGGIPEESIEYAFRMGKPANAPTEGLATVGVYGIGMKRSIFKMGKNAVIKSNPKFGNPFDIKISEDWLHSDDDWEIPVQIGIEDDSEKGTTIEVNDLHKEIKDSFKNSNFINSLKEKIIYTYSYIIQKGFSIYLNDEKIEPHPITLRYEDSEHKGKNQIAPFIYTASIDDVDIKLIVGFYDPIPTEEENAEGLETAKYSGNLAGWTVVCNDRIVLYKDKTELTGWGVDYPRFHNQFNSISGIVYFTSNNPEKLPITTTKRGVDANSVAFIKAKKHMIEGTKIFIKYTNQWKNEYLEEGNQLLAKSKADSPLNLISKIKTTPEVWTNVRGRKDEQKFIPNLPAPEAIKLNKKKISFSRSNSDIEAVKNFLSLDSDCSPSTVGESTFDYVLEEAKKS
jgi:hypothetical protein